MSDTTSDANVAEEGEEGAPAAVAAGATMQEDGSIVFATADGEEVDTIPSNAERAAEADEAAEERKREEERVQEEREAKAKQAKK